MKRVHQIAKEYNISSKALIAMLKEMDIEVKNHMSSVSDEVLDKIKAKFQQEEEQVKKKYQKKKLLHKTEKGEKKTDNQNKAAKDKESAKKNEEDQLVNLKYKKTKKFDKGKKFTPNFQKNKEIEQKNIKQSVKKTLAKMTQSKKIKKYKKNVDAEENIQEESRVLHVPEFISTGELADLLKVDSSEVIRHAMDLGIMATINQRLDMDVISLIAAEFDYEVQQQKDIEYIEEEAEEEQEGDVIERSPIVTIMGQVHHGKTTLLDYIRNSNIVDTESGGITQHIGAYRVEYNERTITFIDTPGHEAFTTMRARGAQITDLVIIVVAANDGIMPQTIEAINHAKAANVPIIVAINKIDLPTVNIDRVRQQLSENGLTVEEWGGDTISVPISAKKGTNVDKLLEMVLIVAELEELTGDPDRKGVGTIVESKLDKGRGSVGTMIVKNGKIEIGDNFVCGYSYGKVRAMYDEHGNRINCATVSQPVQIVGFSSMPSAGDKLQVVENESDAKQIANKRMILKRERDFRSKNKISLENLYDHIKSGDTKELNVLIKGDTNGSIEAIADSIIKLSNSEVKINIIHKGVGGIIDTDIMLASASNAIIIGFHVRPSSAVRELAKKENVNINTYEIIYDVLEDVEASLKGLQKPKFEEITTGEAHVRETFRIPKIGLIAGSYVKSGTIKRSSKVRVIRDGIVLTTGNISSLKRFKDDVREVASGYECGIGIEGFNDIKENDILEQIEKREITT